MTLNELINEGRAIKASITKVVLPPNVIAPTSYKFADTTKYEAWSNKTIRYLTLYFTEDRCITDFEKAIEGVVKARNSPNSFDKLLGILEACLEFPEIPKKQDGNQGREETPIQITVNQSQTQSQQQSIAFEIFIESIKDELTGKQQKEIKAIIDEEVDPANAKTKIVDKIKSFGSDIASNIIANIITNPAIWGNF